MRAVTYRNGHILIPCSGGVTTLACTNGAFDVFGASLENTNSVRTIYKRPGGGLFVGSYLYNFVEFDEVSGTSKKRSDYLISCILPWQKDSLLVGMEGGGLWWYLPSGNRHLSLFRKGADSEVDRMIICVTRQSDTSFWAGTSQGAYLLNPYSGQILKSVAIDHGRLLSHLRVYDILKVGSACFFATHSGLFKYDMRNKTLVKLLTGMDGNVADSYFTCLELANNQVWAGTEGNGLLVLDTAGMLVRKITTAEGLAGNVIFSNPVCKSNLFVGTRTGLSIIDTYSGKISNYSSEYYLPANEFNRSACFVNGDTVYMGTINGLIRIDIKRLQQQQATVATGVCFSKFTFSNGSTNTSDYTVPYRKDLSLTIPPDATNFSIGFGGLSEMANGLTLYYRLDADDGWQEIGQRREVTFIDISPNKYTMQIAARLPDGKWMENMLSLPITVQPHFYQTWWWKTLLFAVALALIWLGIKYRERALRKEEQLRSRIAGDLHDEVGSALTRIFVQAGMLITNKGAAPPPAAALQQIASSSQEALSSMSDMVWSIDAHYDNAADMVDRIRDYIARLREELDCHCSFQVSGNYEKLRLSQVFRQNILLIFKEATNNAIKYGVDKTVAINLVLDEHLLLLEVMNELPATALAENTVQGGHGMKSMQLRADKIGARLSIDQTATTFTVRLKGKPS